MNYSEKLKDPRWQKKRLEIFERDLWTCQSCGRNDQTLNIHHLRYLANCDPWEYDDSHLITYCEKCHESEHLIGGEIRDDLIEIIKDTPLLIKPISQLCILSEKFYPFRERLRSFLTENMIIYLQEMKNQTNAQPNT